MRQLFKESLIIANEAEIMNHINFINTTWKNKSEKLERQKAVIDELRKVDKIYKKKKMKMQKNNSKLK